MTSNYFRPAWLPFGAIWCLNIIYKHPLWVELENVRSLLLKTACNRTSCATVQQDLDIWLGRFFLSEPSEPHGVSCSKPPRRYCVWPIQRVVNLQRRAHQSYTLFAWHILITSTAGFVLWLLTWGHHSPSCTFSFIQLHKPVAFLILRDEVLLWWPVPRSDVPDPEGGEGWRECVEFVWNFFKVAYAPNVIDPTVTSSHIPSRMTQRWRPYRSCSSPRLKRPGYFWIPNSSKFKWPCFAKSCNEYEQIQYWGPFDQRWTYWDSWFLETKIHFCNKLQPSFAGSREGCLNSRKGKTLRAG